MRKTQSIVAAACAGVAIAGGVIVASPLASAASVERCDTTVDQRPVVLTVHGFKGDPSTFSDLGPSGSMDDSIRSISRVNLVPAFNYQAYNTQWVTDEHIGKALAEQINCLSSASKEAGGDGKVIVLAHSMGGLALREALNQTNPVYVKPEKVGLAIMMGTPHQGSDFGYFGGSINLCLPSTGSLGFNCMRSPAIRAMRPGSSELKALPKLPDSVPLRAIAGNVSRSERYGTDSVVTVDSATDEYTTDYPGDGRVVINCSRVWPPWATRWCEHKNLPKDTQVQTSVIQALGEYLNDRPDPSPSPTCTPTASPTPTPSGGEIGGTGNTGGAGEIGGVGGEPSATPVEPSPTMVPSQPSCA